MKNKKLYLMILGLVTFVLAILKLFVIAAIILIVFSMYLYYLDEQEGSGSIFMLSCMIIFLSNVGLKEKLFTLFVMFVGIVILLKLIDRVRITRDNN